MDMKKLYKSRTDVKIDGVCGGLAHFIGLDSTLVRLLWVIISLFGGAGVLLYIVCMVIIPREPDVRDYPDDGQYKN